MNAIFWMSVFAAVMCYGRFFMMWLGLWLTGKGYGRCPKERLAVNYYGIVHFLQFWWLFAGIGFTILAVTL